MRIFFLLIARVLKWEKTNEFKSRFFGCSNEFIETFRMIYKGKQCCLVKREYSCDGTLWFITSLKNWNE